jgi:hypothetical protein
LQSAPALGPLSAHLASIERQTGQRPQVQGASAVKTQCPRELAHVWRWFYELAARRTSHGMGVNPIAYTEVVAWVTCMRRSTAPWEVSLIMRLDDLMLATMREAQA